MRRFIFAIVLTVIAAAGWLGQQVILAFVLDPGASSRNRPGASRACG